MDCLWNCLCSYLCCCCNEYKRDEKEIKAERRRQKAKNLGLLEAISKKPLKSNFDPMDVKTAEITDMFDIKSAHEEKERLNYLEIYIESKSFAKGSFGSIHRARIGPNKVLVCCKQIVVPKNSERMKTMIDVKNELYVLQKTKHPHIILLIQHFLFNYRTHITLFMVMRLAVGGDLSQHTEQFGPFDENKCKHWFAQILSAMVYMHSRNIAHRDLKLSNLLLDEEQDVLISDFGLSRIVYRMDKDKGVLETRTYCGTPPYMAPELLKNIKLHKPYNAFKVDVWAMGVILFKLFDSEYPFPCNPKRALKHMKRKILHFSHQIQSQPSDGLRDILNLIFEYDINRRPEMQNLSTHPWISAQFSSLQQKITNDSLGANND